MEVMLEEELLLTVTLQVAEQLPEIAVIVAVPAATAVTFPEVTVATEALEDFQVTDCVELAGSTVAVRVAVLSVSMDSVELLSVIDVVLTSEVETVTAQVPLTDPEVAVIVEVPAATAVTFPELETVATEVSDDSHDSVSVVLAGFTVAVSVEVSPTARDSEVLLREIDVVGTLASVTVTLQVALLESAVAVIVAVPAATAVTFP